MSDQFAPDFAVQNNTPKATNLEVLAQLEELFSEVQALAVRLRQESRRRQPNEGASSAGHNVLGLLSRFGPLTVPQIARLNLTSRQNIQTIVNRLEREEWVELVPNPAHKRSELVRLTDRGLASLELVSRESGGYKERVVSQLSREGLTQASAVLRSIREVLVIPPSRDAGTAKLKTRRQSYRSPSEGEKVNAPQSRGEGRLNRGRAFDSEGVQADRIPPQEDELPISLL